MSALVELESRFQESLSGTVIGMRTLIRALLIATVSRGHVLVQGAPGLGKTLLGKTLASSLGGRFSRVQGTADLMPSDITGVHVFEEATRQFKLHPGPVFTEILLVDEINRAGPKTQSALLEAMAERQVSIDRQTYPLPPGFLVIATQNPHEFEGTYPLPESQLDRFMMRVDVGYPSAEDEAAVLSRYGTIAASEAASGASTEGSSGVENAAGVAGATGAITAGQIAAARVQADQIHVSAEVLNYVTAIATASRGDPNISLGLSTRGAIALLRGARVAAGLRGSAFVTPDDVKAMAPWIIPHRLGLSPDALLERRTDHSLVSALLERVPVPRG